MAETYGKMEDAYREVCLMFSESPKTTEPADFFGMFQKFSQDWKVRGFNNVNFPPSIPVLAMM